jgi:hypothetical protein
MRAAIDLTDSALAEVARVPVPGEPPVPGAQWDEVNARWEAWDPIVQRWHVVGGPREERAPGNIEDVFVTHAAFDG